MSHGKVYNRSDRFEHLTLSSNSYPFYIVEQVFFPHQHAAIQVLLIYAWNARYVQC